VSGVGETEASCREKNKDFVVGRAFYSDNARGKIVGDAEGLTKLLVCPTTKKVLGVHVVGESATELVHIGQTVLHLEGTGKCISSAPVIMIVLVVGNMEIGDKRGIHYKR